MIKLSDKERMVFTELQADAWASIADIAKRCTLTESVVRYALESMTRRGILQTSLVIDETKLGLRHLKYLLNIEPSPNRTLAEVENAITTLPSVSWLTRIMGQYSHYMSLYVNELSEASLIFDLLQKKTGKAITRHLMAEGIGWEYYGKKYLHKAKTPRKIIRTGFPSPPIALTELDSELIGELAMRPLAPNRELARTLGRPVSSITYRKTRLVEAGVISAPIIRIRVTETELLAYLIEIKSKYPSATFNRELHQFAAKHPHITQVCNCFGSWDFEIGLEAEEAHTIHSTITELAKEFSQYIDELIILHRFGDVVIYFDIRNTLKNQGKSATA